MGVEKETVEEGPVIANLGVRGSRHFGEIQSPAQKSDIVTATRMEHRKTRRFAASRDLFFHPIEYNQNY